MIAAAEGRDFISSGLTTLGYAFCGGNQTGGGPCYAYTEAHFSPNEGNDTLYVSADFRVIDIVNDVFGGSNFSTVLPTPDDLFVQITLPDGFSIEGVAPLPEPSTYAMLLIGFVAIGFVWRRKGSLLVKLG